jgi:hypothetical protein
VTSPLSIGFLFVDGVLIGLSSPAALRFSVLVLRAQRILPVCRVVCQRDRAIWGLHLMPLML